MEIAANKSAPSQLKATMINWRVDVSISTSSLSKTLEPSVIMELTLSNGQVVSFEIPMGMFHVFRFNVALVIKEMDDILNRQIFKFD